MQAATHKEQEAEAQIVLALKIAPEPSLATARLSCREIPTDETLLEDPALRRGLRDASVAGGGPRPCLARDHRPAAAASGRGSDPAGDAVARLVVPRRAGGVGDGRLLLRATRGRGWHRGRRPARGSLSTTPMCRPPQCRSSRPARSEPRSRSAPAASRCGRSGSSVTAICWQRSPT